MNMVRKRKKFPKKSEVQDQKDAALRILAVLEENEMNMSKTAKECAVSRQSLYRWKEKYWQEYIDNKIEIKDQVETIAAIKVATVEEFNEVREKMKITHELALLRLREILEDPAKIKYMAARDIVQLINVLSPYIVDKPSVAGVDKPSDEKTKNQTTFVQNIIHEMNIRGEKIKKQVKDK